MQPLSALETVHEVHEANYNFLSLQMDANLQTELHMQEFLHEKAKAAYKFSQESDGSITKNAASAAAWGLPILSWLFMNSQSLTVLPFIVQRLIPHVLRKSAEHVQPFWFFASIKVL
jgi:hypothetical protein